MANVFVRAVFASGVLLAIGLSAVPDAKAHSLYEYSCCSDRDCQPIAFDDVQVTPRGYVINSSGILIPFDDVRIRMTPVEDVLQRYHICTTSGKKAGPVICLYVPQGGA